MIKRVGLFDSGLGGLTVLKALSSRFPQLEYVYYADTAHAPYGDKPVEELRGYNQHIIRTLAGEKCDLVVFACNTSIALFYREFSNQHLLSVPTVEIITPGAHAALKASASKRIGVLATTRTCNSHIYRDTILAADQTATVVELACPELVPLIESDQLENPGHYETLVSPLHVLHAQGIDTVIYGCSHYPFLEKLWKKAYPKFAFVNPADALGEALEPLLGSETPSFERGTMTFFDSGESLALKRWIAHLFLDHKTTLKQGVLSH